MKRLPLFIALFSLLFILSACGTENQATDEEPKPETETKVVEEETIMTDLGIYIGQADPHTVEIEVNEGPKAFQLTEESTPQIEELEQNDEVQFMYFINEQDQNMLYAIEKLQSDGNEDEDTDENKPSMTEATGVYNGQADPHTIEIETDEGPTAFQLNDDARKDVEKLTVGKDVEFTYYEDDPQLIIETIRQSE